MNKYLSVATVFACVLFSTSDLFSQSLGYSGGLCTGSSIDIYITGGYPCGAANVSSPSGWYVSPTPSSITYNYNNGYYNSIRVTWNSAVSATVRASYNCSDDGSSGTTSNLYLTINSAVTPSVGLSLSTTNVCYGGGSITFTASPTNGGSSPSYTYYVNGTSVYNGSASSYTYSTSSLAAGSHSAYVVMWSSLACTTPSASATSTTKSFTVTSKSSYTASISGPGLVCSGTSTITLYATVTGGVGNLSYEWFVNGSPSWGSNSFTTNATHGNNIYCKVYSDYWCVNSPVQTNTYTISVTNSVTPTVSIQIPKTNYCPGESITFTASSSYIISSSTYSWYLNGSLLSVPNTAQSISLTASSSNIAGYYYPGSTVSVTVNGLSGTCLTSNSATGNTSAANVYTVPNASASNQSICSGTASSISITNPNGVSGTTYSWTASASNVTGSGNGTGALIAQTLSCTNGVSNGTVTYTITPSANGCVGTPITATVTVKPIPNASASSQSICSGQTTSIAITNPNGVSGTTFSWTVSQSNTSGASSGGGNTIAQTLTATTSLNGTATYTITPTANGCSGSTVSPVATVKPVPTVSAGNQSICSGQTTSIAITNPNNVTGTTFSWTVSSSNVSGASSGTGNTIGQTLSATTSSNGTATYTVTATANGCSSATSTVATVKPLPNASSANQYLFSGQTTSIGITNPNGVSGTTFSWTAASTNTSGASSGSGSTISQLLTSTNGGTATYTITPTASGCSGSSITSVATVYANPIITSSNARIIMGPVTLTSSGGYETYTWKNSVNTVMGNDQSLSISTPDTYTITVTKSGASGTSLPFVLEKQFSGQLANYIVSYSMLVDGIAPGTLVESIPVEKISQSVQYFDGLGRPLQTVITQGSPTKQDIIQPAIYDQFGRETRKFLPYTNGSDGWMKTTVFNGNNFTGAALDFYTNAGKVAQETQRPFSETIFEDSPLNRPLQDYGPGQTWFSNNKYTGHGYNVNIDGNVNSGEEKIVNWSIIQATVNSKIVNLVSQNGFWPSNSFNIKVTIDEDNKQVREYSDRQGRVLLKKVQASTPPTTYDDSKWAVTYYVYDDFDRLRFVLQPEFNALITTYNTADNTNKNTMLNGLAFEYTYDGRGRMATKRVPGSGIIYMVYDNRDRLVLTQDGKQRSTSPKYWSFTKYDVLNRPILTGIKDTTADLSQAQMQDVVNAHYNKTWAKWGEAYIGSAASNVHGYTNKSYPIITSGSTVNQEYFLTATYYDDYSYRNLWSGSYTYSNEGLSATHNGILYNQPGAEFLQVRGMITGNKVKVLDGGITGGYTWLKTATYYDDKLRVIQVVTDNYKGGEDRTSTLYDFAGKILKTKTTHTKRNVTWKDLVNVNVVGNKLIATASSWGSSGAASVQQLAAGQNGWLEVTASETNLYRMIGLSDQNTNASYTSIDYAFYQAVNALQIYENAVLRLTVSGAYKPGDVLKIDRTGTTIRYYKNNTLVYTSATASSSVLMADAAFYNSGATIVNTRTSFSAVSKTISRRFEYDHAGRLLKTWHQIDAEPEILLTFNEYNELGQLVDKKLHSTGNNTSTAKQSVDYRYNIRGWLMSMNNAALSNDGATNDDTGDYFGMNLAYNNTDLGVSNTPLFNGNISGMTWSNNQGLGTVKQNGYVYTYDPMNRISSSSFTEKATLWTAPGNSAFSETGYTYDLNGNLKTMQRNDKRGTGWMDNMTYNYGTGTTQSNKLLKVEDAGDDFAGFIDGNPGTTDDYTYDANGNLTRDLNKGIGASLTDNTNIITYNFLNLPETVTKGGNNVRYIYDATGRKLSQVTTFGITQKQTDYTGEFTYENDVLQFINHEEGRVVLIATKTLFTSDCGSLSGMSAINGASAIIVSQNGSQSYVQATSSGSQWGGVSINGIMPAVPGERYKIRMKGYKATAAQPYMLIKTNLGNLSWYEVLLPSSYSVETWVEQIVTIPAGANQLLVYLTYDVSVAGDKFFLNDVEIIKLENAAPEYQYNLKDHLGNVRLTFTTKAEKETFTATFEDNTQATETATFKNYSRNNFDLFDHTDASTVYTYSQLLNGGNNYQVGLAKTLSVMPGDTIKVEVYAKYRNLTSTTGNLTAFASALTGAFGLNSTMVGDPGAAYDALNDYGTLIAGGYNHSEDLNAPKAYLNILLFDRNYNFVDAAYKQIGVNDIQTDPVIKAPHGYLSREKIVTEPGYAFIFLSNEHPTQVDVYFDDLKITHAKSPVIQMEDYYAFGLAFNSYSRENTTPNNYLYNGKELQDELALNTYDFGFRQYDPAIARWNVVDPLAEKRYWMNPYNYVQNNPMNRFDPNGLTDYTLDKKTGDVKKVADTKDATDRIVKTRKDGSIKRKGEGFLGGLVRESKRGEAKTAVGGIEKGILKDGQNFRNKDEVISVGGEGQASVDGVKSFTLKLSEYVGKEIKGFSYSSDASGNATDIVLGKYKNNDVTHSFGSVTELVKKYGSNFSSNNVLQEFHTHPNGELGATQSSPHLSDDVRTLQSDKPQMPNASFIILYRIAGQEKPGEYDYTHEYRR